MNEELIRQLCLQWLPGNPRRISRCGVGIGNYVYLAEYAEEQYIIRCIPEMDAYRDTVFWLKKLGELSIPVPQVIRSGSFLGYEYLILTFLEGQDLGLAYPGLKDTEKRAIAKDVVRIQNLVANLEPEGLPADWSWWDFIREMLDRAEERIRQNGFFEVERVERLRQAARSLKAYFDEVPPVIYLDDISSKNLLIHNGKLSGIIDVDWIGVGDPLTYVALTRMALLDLEYDTDYTDYILEEMEVTGIQNRAFLFYTLLYCVDFMGERGMCFAGRTVPVSDRIVEKLNGIYDALWIQWCCGDL